jgi:hypothetical protein
MILPNRSEDDNGTRTLLNLVNFDLQSQHAREAGGYGGEAGGYGGEAGAYGGEAGGYAREAGGYGDSRRGSSVGA